MELEVDAFRPVWSSWLQFTHETRRRLSKWRSFVIRVPNLICGRHAEQIQDFRTKTLEVVFNPWRLRYSRYSSYSANDVFLQKLHTNDAKGSRLFNLKFKLTLAPRISTDFQHALAEPTLFLVRIRATDRKLSIDRCCIY